MHILNFFNNNDSIEGDINQLSIIDDEDRNLYSLFEAIIQVRRFYYEFNSAKKTRLERIFAYELYHKWSMLLDEKYETDANGYRKYILNAETGKNLNYFDKKQEGTKYPDMVLHRSMEEPNGQCIVCEFKRQDNFRKDSFKEDLDKLYTFVCEKKNGYNFGHGIFVLINGTILAILKKLELINFREGQKKEDEKKIFLIALKEQKMEVVSLYDAMCKKDRDNYIKNNKR